MYYISMEKNYIIKFYITILVWNLIYISKSQSQNLCSLIEICGKIGFLDLVSKNKMYIYIYIYI